MYRTVLKVSKEVRQDKKLARDFKPKWWGTYCRPRTKPISVSDLHLKIVVRRTSLLRKPSWTKVKIVRSNASPEEAEWGEGSVTRPRSSHCLGRGENREKEGAVETTEKKIRKWHARKGVEALILNFILSIWRCKKLYKAEIHTFRCNFKRYLVENYQSEKKTSKRFFA